MFVCILIYHSSKIVVNNVYRSSVALESLFLTSVLTDLFSKISQEE